MQKMVSQFPDHGQIINSLLRTHSLPKTIGACRLKPGVPCKPMLAKPTKSLNTVFSRLENLKFTCEFKYDGLRGQIHYEASAHLLRIFSRNLEDMTEQYPDIALQMAKFANDRAVVRRLALKSEPSS